MFPETPMNSQTTKDSRIKPIFRAGEYRVDVTEMMDKDVPVTGVRKVFALEHEPTGVIAGYSQQLPGAIRAAVELQADTIKAVADPYSLANATGSGAGRN